MQATPTPGGVRVEPPSDATPWQRCLPEVCQAGDVGGDVQVSDAWEARWQRQLPDGHTARVTRAYYVAADQVDGTADGPVHLECQTEYLVCTDVSDPGGTEVWGDYTYATVPLPTRPDAEAARRAVAAAGEPTDAEWRTQAPTWVAGLGSGPATAAKASTYDEEVEGIAEGFKHELCPGCGGDIDDHDIAPDPLGHAHAWCRPGASRAGDVPPRTDASQPAGVVTAPTINGGSMATATGETRNIATTRAFLTALAEANDNRQAQAEQAAAALAGVGIDSATLAEAHAVIGDVGQVAAKCRQTLAVLNSKHQLMEEAAAATPEAAERDYYRH